MGKSEAEMFDLGCKAEREQCAKIAEAMRAEWTARSHQDGETRLVAEVLGKCAAAIRANR